MWVICGLKGNYGKTRVAAAIDDLILDSIVRWRNIAVILLALRERGSIVIGYNSDDDREFAMEGFVARTSRVDGMHASLKLMHTVSSLENRYIYMVL